ncbi:hypothetical protein VOLCADRAFT_103728 [Volvox carteri f. nagariensis]|uniref:Serine/threonine-protein phosphatase n=1 Tax=Volvox carteri f. nagariensis TaxID=3068 RepID=D8TN68_VOLCA|nr:uncharacterized protein VOLCADRAFT_103728 [Volvox carteri f. nagariensis]EFJ50937.1 hypothetical protein VOLCADRAFT_103728 [Volvox carteri f. nagariensis]|eukprot:XP_002947949.1 hypothetical protein VOLCADRAFT_103728 [Volvox carteri f. nagariensis]
MAVLDLPPTLDQVAQLQARMLEALQGGAAQLKTVLPAEQLVAILRATEAELRQEPSLVEISVEEPHVQVFVFGDTHGHFPDVAHMLKEIGYPSPTRVLVFNGDYVDRGSWGVELLTLLCCLKCAAPNSVYLLRGNHESSSCTKWYGYSQEVRAKYDKQSKEVYSASKKLFSVMPLAALVQRNTLVMHGGLFRKPPEPRRGAKRRKPGHLGRPGGPSALEPGTLDHLRHANKGGMDPDGVGSSLVATDVLWSDPVAAPGFFENDARGVGLVFGPDITEAFLRANGLRLIIRSHEGPDARDKRSDLPQVLQGYSFDHNTPAGQLVTVFSAPDYPQFQVVAEEGEEAGKRFNNLAAVAVLSAPDYATPNMRTFAAVTPRPKADAYYDFAACCDSDADVQEGSEGGSACSSAVASETELGVDEAEGAPASLSGEMADTKSLEVHEDLPPSLDAVSPSVPMAEVEVVAQSAPMAEAELAPPSAPPAEKLQVEALLTTNHADAMEVEEQSQRPGPIADGSIQEGGETSHEAAIAATAYPLSGCGAVGDGTAGAAGAGTDLSVSVCQHTDDQDDGDVLEGPSPLEAPAATACDASDTDMVVSANTPAAEAR